MKVNELMLGDWVNYRPGWINEESGKVEYESGQGFPVKIEMMYESRGEGLVQYNDGENDGIEAAEYELFPLPLTAEILEKNADGGWFNYQSEPKGRSIYHIGKVDLYVEWERIVPSPYIEIHGLGDTFFKGYIDYVHQLQHCLKLIGIDNDIVL